MKRKRGRPEPPQRHAPFVPEGGRRRQRALPFYQLLEDSVARAAGETLPLRFVTLYHPHGIAAEYLAMQPGDTETSFNLDVRQLLAAAVRRRRDLRQELQGQDPASSRGSICSRTPTATTPPARS